MLAFLIALIALIAVCVIGYYVIAGLLFVLTLFLDVTFSWAIVAAAFLFLWTAVIGYLETKSNKED